MVTKKQNFMMYEAIVAISVLSIALIPLAYNIKAETKMLSALYYRSVAEQIIDGHIKLLSSGEWIKYKEGDQKYHINNKAFNQIPKGDVILRIVSLKDNKIKIILEWESIKKQGIGRIYKERVVNK